MTIDNPARRGDKSKGHRSFCILSPRALVESRALRTVLLECRLVLGGHWKKVPCRQAVTRGS